MSYHVIVIIYYCKDLPLISSDDEGVTFLTLMINNMQQVTKEVLACPNPNWQSEVIQFEVDEIPNSDLKVIVCDKRIHSSTIKEIASTNISITKVLDDQNISVPLDSCGYILTQETKKTFLSSILFPKKLNHSISSFAKPAKVYLDIVVLDKRQYISTLIEEFWENQRVDGYGNWSKDQLTIKDSSPWTVTGNIKGFSSLSSASAKLSEEWKTDGWFVALSPESDLFEYAESFNEKLWHNKEKLHFYVRRRKWLRLSYKPNSLISPPSPQKDKKLLLLKKVHVSIVSNEEEDSVSSKQVEKS